MHITIIIISYNSAKFIEQCLDSIIGQMGVNYDIVVVDNASQDNTVDVLKKYQDKVKLITSQNNLGFSAANNIVINDKNHYSDYIFSFNPDAVLPDHNGLAKLVDFMENNPQCGVLSTRVLNKASHRESKPAREYDFQSFCSHDFSQLPGQWAWVIGASILIRGNILRTLGGFGKGFFVYGEDADLCLRMRQAGYTVDILPNVIAYHIGGGCENRSNEYAKRIRKQHGRYVFFSKHYPVNDIMKIARYQRAQSTLHLFLHALRAYLPFIKKKQKRRQHRLAIYHAANTILANPMDPDAILTLLEKPPVITSETT